MSRGRSLSLASPKPGGGIKDEAMRNRGIKMADKAQWKRNKFAKIGEADRVIQTKMPKHLFRLGAGSRGRRDRQYNYCVVGGTAVHAGTHAWGAGPAQKRSVVAGRFSPLSSTCPHFSLPPRIHLHCLRISCFCVNIAQRQDEVQRLTGLAVETPHFWCLRYSISGGWTIYICFIRWRQ